MIILDEFSYAENLIKNGSATSYPARKDVVLLAKYYKYKENETHEIREKLEEYCYKTNPFFNMVIEGWKIYYALNVIKRYKLRIPFPIIVTKTEVENIKSFSNYNYQKILFVLIVIAKFLKYSNNRIIPSTKSRIINSFFINEEMSTIVRIARVSMRKKQRDHMFNEFYKAGFFDINQRFGSLEIKCIEEDSEPEIVVEDMNNVVLSWQRYSGEKIAGCGKCGKLFVKRSNRQQLCPSCFREQRKEKKREYERKYRKERGQLENKQ